MSSDARHEPAAEQAHDQPEDDAAQDVFDAGLGSGFTQDPEP